MQRRDGLLHAEVARDRARLIQVDAVRGEVVRAERPLHHPVHGDDGVDAGYLHLERDLDDGAGEPHRAALARLLDRLQDGVGSAVGRGDYHPARVGSPEVLDVGAGAAVSVRERLDLVGGHGRHGRGGGGAGGDGEEGENDGELHDGLLRLGQVSRGLSDDTMIDVITVLWKAKMAYFSLSQRTN